MELVSGIAVELCDNGDGIGGIGLEDFRHAYVVADTVVCGS